MEAVDTITVEMLDKHEPVGRQSSNGEPKWGHWWETCAAGGEGMSSRGSAAAQVLEVCRL